jgi:phage protein U
MDMDGVSLSASDREDSDDAQLNDAEVDPEVTGKRKRRPARSRSLGESDEDADLPGVILPPLSGHAQRVRGSSATGELRAGVWYLLVELVDAPTCMGQWSVRI